MLHDLIEQHRDRLANKVVVHPSNPVAVNDKGEHSRTLAEGVSSGSVNAGLLPDTAHFVKAFASLSAASLAMGSNRTPAGAVLIYATDDDQSQAAVERLISATLDQDRSELTVQSQRDERMIHGDTR